MQPEPAPAPDASFADPRTPDDDLSFEALAGRYNFETTSLHARVLARLIMKECEGRSAPRRVLDVGCGRGIGRFVDLQWAVRPHAEEYWGLEPDTSKVPPPGLFDHHVHALMDDAPLPADHFDVAYSSMVMEHVADPEAFMRAVHRCLRPGGAYLFMTPNRRHYFTRVASALHRLGLDELVLRIVKRREVEDYHYPVRYLFNDERRIDACCTALGFAPPEYVYLEAEGPLGYFPRPLRFIYHGLAFKRRIIRHPRALISIVGRITRPPAAPSA